MREKNSTYQFIQQDNTKLTFLPYPFYPLNINVIIKTIKSYLIKHGKYLADKFLAACWMTDEADSQESVDLVAQRFELGATWWLECLTPYRAGKSFADEWPVDEMRERVLQGPPQLPKSH